MGKKVKTLLMLLCMALLLSGCGLRTVDQLYCLPKRSDAETDLQSVIDKAMGNLSYSAPIYGDNRQVTQKVDLDGDGVEECLVFAKDNSEQPLKILIFCQLASGYVLMDTIEGYGMSFDFVDYAQMDGQPGLEIIVGRQLSNQVMRSISVYRFSSEISRQLMTASCSRFLTCDLNKDGNKELLLLSAGESEGGDGVLSVYQLEDGQIQRTSMTNISEADDRVMRTNIGTLQGGTPAVYITSLTGDSTLVTDIFAMKGDVLSPVLQSAPVATLDGNYIYPTDVDDDGILELPRLEPILEHPQQQKKRFFLCWYSVDDQGNTFDVLYTYTSLTQGWYIDLKPLWLETLTVTEDADSTSFYMLNKDHEKLEKLMTVYMLADSDREQVVEENRYTILYEAEAVIYAAKLDPWAKKHGIDEDRLKTWFHIMRTELNTDKD